MGMGSGDEGVRGVGRWWWVGPEVEGGRLGGVSSVLRLWIDYG